MNQVIIEMAIMSEGNDFCDAKQVGSRFFVGGFVEVGCSFTKTVSTFCVRLTDLFKTRQEAEEAAPAAGGGMAGYFVVENRPVVLQDGSLKYHPTKSCLAPIRMWALEELLKLRIR